MKTNYVVLWIDDEMTSVNSHKVEISDFLNTKGIKTQYVDFDMRAALGSEEQVLSEISKKYNENPDLDIVLIDFKMSNGDAANINGDEIIKILRDDKHNMFLPVIFYSSLADDMKKAAAQNLLEGVFFADKDDVAYKTKLVLDSLLVKEHTIKSTRGLLMESLSEIDVAIGSVAKTTWSKLEPKDKEKFHNYFKENFVDNRLKSYEKKQQKFPANVDTFEEEVVNSDLVSKHYETNTRWQFLHSILEHFKHDVNEFMIYKDIVKDPKKDPNSLMNWRNNYGHKSDLELKSEHNDEACIKMRKEVVRQIDNIKKIKQKYES